MFTVIYFNIVIVLFVYFLNQDKQQKTAFRYKEL